VLPYAIGFEVLLWLTGFVLLWRVLFGSLRRNSHALTVWPVSVEGFFTAALLAACGAVLLPYATTYLSNDILGVAATEGKAWQTVQGCALQLGLLSGALIAIPILRIKFFRTSALTIDASATSPTRHLILAGTSTFLIALPLISGIGYIWTKLLEVAGCLVLEQEVVSRFRNSDDPFIFILMLVFALVIAPVTEELIFRAGIFRYLRTRIPRGLAYLIPAIFFAFLHVNWKTLEGLNSFVPLTLLAVLFSYSYERTGRIAVPMIAHALFNLHTIILVIAGVTV
jgi:uncharacterized protein